MKYLYYPGCSLKSTGKAYEESLLTVLKRLDVAVQEIDDWNCCGATSYMAVDEVKAFALAARNLALAEEQGGEEAQVMAPCAACYLVLSKAQHNIAESPEINRRVISALREAQLNYNGHAKVRHPLDILLNDVGLEQLEHHASKPLSGMKVACYYGCQIVRPYATFDDQANPTSMDRILQAMGAEIVDWPLKTHCCGGTMTGTIEDVGLCLNFDLLHEAKKRGATVLATACPLCQFNLECYQTKIAKQHHENVSLPVAYFTQLMGLALGASEQELGLKRLFVPLKASVAA